MANVIVPKNKGTQKLFQNPVLEKLTRTHIAVPLTIFAVFSLALLAWSVTHTSLSASTTIGLFLLGVIAFTWVEYVVHRFVFHMKTYTVLRTKIQYIVHGVHHEYPKDKDRLAMPPLLSVTITTILLLLFRLVMGDFTFAFLPGFLVGYAAYLGVHYMVHAFAPPKNIFKFLWINHGTHHYKNGEMIYGVSSPLWDYIYGTMKKKNLSAK
jgi:sterol desaturase/sphingolipid hydroxylase (fatty acid hydroxylase superfamily)